MVCVGGTEEVERGAALFRELGGKAPLYVMCLTGRESLVTRKSKKDIRIIDPEIVNRIQGLAENLSG